MNLFPMNWINNFCIIGGSIRYRVGKQTVRKTSFRYDYTAIKSSNSIDQLIKKAGLTEDWKTSIKHDEKMGITVFVVSTMPCTEHVHGFLNCYITRYSYMKQYQLWQEKYCVCSPCMDSYIRSLLNNALWFKKNWQLL